MSLIEMMVAISIFGMGIFGFTILFIRTWQSNSFILEEGMASSQAARTVNEVSKQLRGIKQSETGSYMIKKAAGSELVVYYNDDEDEQIERVRYYVDEDNDVLIKGVAKASGTPLGYPIDYSSDTETVMARYVMNNAISEPVFKYYDDANNELTPPTLTAIKLIEVNLWINIKPSSAPENVRFGTSVELRNLDEGV